MTGLYNSRNYARFGHLSPKATGVVAFFTATGGDPLPDPTSAGRNPANSDPDWFDQSPTWKPEEILLDDARTLVLEYI